MFGFLQKRLLLWVCLISTILIRENVTDLTQNHNKHSVGHQRLSAEFRNFINELDLNVYKNKKNLKSQVERQTQHPQRVAAIKPYLNEIGDTLMLKLIAYYENKYGLSNGDIEITTEDLTDIFSKVSPAAKNPISIDTDDDDSQIIVI